MPVFDLLLKGGTVIDGQRTPRFTGDVAIAGANCADWEGVRVRRETRIRRAGSDCRPGIHRSTHVL